MEKPVYTHTQMREVMSRCRSWTLNNPSGALPYLPVMWIDTVSDKENFKAMYETLPPYKKTNKLLSFLMWCKIL